MVTWDALWVPIGATPELTVMMASMWAAVARTRTARSGA